MKTFTQLRSKCKERKVGYCMLRCKIPNVISKHCLKRNCPKWKGNEKDLREVLRSILKLEQEEVRLRKEYVWGSCNAEDVWRDYFKKKETLIERAKNMVGI